MAQSADFMASISALGNEGRWKRRKAVKMKAEVGLIDMHLPSEAEQLKALLKSSMNAQVCPKCRNKGKWYRLTGRKAFACACGHQISPTAGTIFHKSRTPLEKWYQALLMLEATNDTVSAKELERHLKVTYKTAWRMKNLLTGKAV